MKKKILMILTEFPPAIGGMQTHAINLTEHLHKKGMHICVYTYRSGESGDQCRAFDNSLPFDVHRVLSRLSYFYTIDILIEAVKKFKPDFIYSSTVFYGILSRMTSVPTVCRSVGNDIMRPWIIYPFKKGMRIMSLPFIEDYCYQRFKKLYRPEIVEIMFRKKRTELAIESAQCASSILANSDFTRKILVRNGIHDSRITTLVGGVDSQFFRKPESIMKDPLRLELDLPVGKTILFTACRLVDKKGINFLIRLMANPLSVKFNLHLLIAGDGRRRKRFMEMVSDLGISERVTFTGSIPYRNMPPYFWASDIFVLASTMYKYRLTGLCDAETMGRVLCEANASGIPVIASRTGGIPSVIKDGINGLLFEENSESDLFQKLELLLFNAGLKRRIISGGIEMAGKVFDWRHIMDAHEKIFSTVSGHHD
jgi:glycosyltransferase involved in cell wall biosynthesis